MPDAQYHPGATILVPSDTTGWQPMKVISCTGFGEAVTIHAHNAGDAESSARTLEKQEVPLVEECDMLALDGAPDMVKFTKLSEATLLHNLRVRYCRDDIYTRAGSILISVNPFKQLTIYTSEAMARCKVRVRTNVPTFDYWKRPAHICVGTPCGHAPTVLITPLHTGC